MAKLIYVGTNDDNVSGSSSKAYTIRRVGRNVIAQYGSVQILGGRGGKIHWLGSPRQVTWAFRSVHQAAMFVKNKVAEKEAGYYDKLPGRVRIAPARK